LALNGRESKQSGQSKGEAIAAESCERTSAESKSMEMCAESELTISEQLTFSVADSLASHQAQREHERALQILAGSGQKCFELFALSGRAGSWQKTFMASCLLKPAEFSTRFTHSWKAKVLSACPRLWFQLRLLEHRTYAIASGLLPTPTRGDAENRKATPSPHFMRTGTVRHIGKNGQQSQIRLSQYTQMFPTPRAGDAKNNTYQRDRGEKGKERPTLTGVVKFYPTPQASDADKWSNQSEAERLAKGQQVRLPTAVSPQGGAGGILNPEFVEWLMGFPIGWSDLGDLETRLSRKCRNGLAGE
jgi:hypothetical protein